MDNEVDVADLKTLKKKYIGQTINKEIIDHDGNYYRDESQTIEIEFAYLENWSGDEYTYFSQIVVDDQWQIKKVYALKCQLLCGDDAKGSTYRGKRADEYDYSRYDKYLNKFCKRTEG